MHMYLKWVQFVLFRLIAKTVIPENNFSIHCKINQVQLYFIIVNNRIDDTNQDFLTHYFSPSRNQFLFTQVTLKPFSDHGLTEISGTFSSM